jgi:hypothetical protein
MIELVDDTELAFIAGVSVFGSLWIYAIVRVAWRLWRDDVEPAGRDSDTWRRMRRKRRPRN